MVEGPTLFICEIVAFIICDEVDDGPVSQRGRLIQHDAPILNARSQAQVDTIRACCSNVNLSP